jgi:hypothetical protein
METPESLAQNPPEKPEVKPTPSDILQGFCWVAVTHKSGTVERVKLRLLNVREVVEYFEKRSGNPAAAAEFFAGKKEGWADSLKSQSVYEVASIGERLNADPFEEHLRFVQDRAARVIGLAKKAESPLPVS